MEIPVNSLMTHTCTKKMLQLILLVYTGENSMNLSFLDIIITLAKGTSREFKKLFLELDNTHRLHLNCWSSQVGPEITRLGCLHRKDKQQMSNG